MKPTMAVGRIETFNSATYLSEISSCFGKAGVQLGFKHHVGYATMRIKAFQFDRLVKQLSLSYTMNQEKRFIYCSVVLRKGQAESLGAMAWCVSSLPRTHSLTPNPFLRLTKNQFFPSALTTHPYIFSGRGYFYSPQCWFSVLYPISGSSRADRSDPQSRIWHLFASIY